MLMLAPACSYHLRVFLERIFFKKKKIKKKIRGSFFLRIARQRGWQLSPSG